MRDTVVAMQSSRIREVANVALKNPDVLAFWFGESDEVTPLAVREAAMRSLERGETFYGHNLGMRELRDALARYMTGFHPAPSRRAHRCHQFGRQRADAGHRIAGGIRRRGSGGGAGVAQSDAATHHDGGPVKRVALAPDAAGAWRLDMQTLVDAVTPQTKVRAGQFAEQSDRLDADARRAAGLLDALPPHRHLDRRGRGLRAHVVRPMAAAHRAFSTSRTPTTA